jgi:hypothetical protein
MMDNDALLAGVLALLRFFHRIISSSLICGDGEASENGKRIELKHTLPHATLAEVS